MNIRSASSLVSRARHLVSSRWARRLARAAAVLLGLWLILWLAVPPLVKGQIEQQGSALTGRVVRVERVDFQPWSLELTLTGLSVAAPTGNIPQLSIDRLYADLEIQSVLRAAPIIDALTLEHPRLRLAHDGAGRYDIDDILARLTQAPAQPGSSKPPRFGVFNIRLAGGQIEFDDRPKGITHHLRDLNLDIPFLSNLNADREVITRPRLRFTLDGSAFDFQAATTPFADNRRTDITLNLPHFDVAPYLPYWPASAPVGLQSGQLEARVTVHFERQDTPQVTLSGHANITQLALSERAPRGTPPPLARVESLEIALAHARPLERSIHLSRIAVTQPTLHIRRDASGQINLLALIPPPSDAPPWTIGIDAATVRDGRMLWADARPAANLAIEHIAMDLQQARLPGQTAAPFALSATVAGGTLWAQGTGHATAAQATMGLTDFPLAAIAPYLKTALKPAVAGSTSATAQLAWQAGQDASPSVIKLTDGRVQLNDVTLKQQNSVQAGWRSLNVEGIEADTQTQSATLGRVTLTQPVIHATRDEQGRWMFADWQTTAAPPATAAPNPWALKIGEFRLTEGKGSLTDHQPTRPVQLNLDALSVTLRDIQPLSASPAPMPLSLSFDLSAPSKRKRDAGHVSYQGSLRLPGATAAHFFRTNGQLRAERMPIHAVEPYFADHLNLDLIRADAGFRGTVDASLPPQGMALKLAGNASIDDLRATTLTPREDLLDWKSLTLRGTVVEVSAGQLRRLSVDETVLTDYFARVIINESGRINLQDLTRAPESTPPSTSPSDQNTKAPPPAVPADIRMGPISLVNGRVAYSDRFIKPNYSATLTELTGSLGAFSNQRDPSGAPKLADLTLHGRAEGTATLDISGTLNPLATPLALDLKGTLRTLELPPLSPYSAKYAGYGIERGKLSMDVSYRIGADGALTASNQIVLNQLQFGDRVDSPDAPNLPVKLAVALLADRHGVIDINLPISGSINDPQFKLGPTIVRLIFNLIGKAITAPFALLGGSLSSADHPEWVRFAPGNRVLTPDMHTQLATVARALADRPALTLTIVGQSDLTTEESAWRRAQLSLQIQAEKRRQQARQGLTPSADTTVSDAEYPALLQAVYKRADIKKPRTVIGLAKDLPLADMESLLLAAIPTNSDAMRELALARSVAVRDFLVSQGVQAEQLFLGAPQTEQSEKTWVPNATLKLSVR